MNNETKIRNNMLVWGLTSAGENALERRGRDAGIEKNNEEYEGKEGRGDIRPDAGSAVHRIVRRVNMWDATRYGWRVNGCRR